MASIRERSGSWQARVSRDGYPPEVKSFPTKAEALKWARHMEASMDAGAYRARTATDKASLCDLLSRYADEVSPSKRGHREEVIRIRALQRSRMAGFALEKLTPTVVASFRDERLRHVKAGAAIRDLSLLSSVVNHARREWVATIDNPCLLVKKPVTPNGRTRVLSSDEEERLLTAVAPAHRRNAEIDLPPLYVPVLS